MSLHFPTLQAILAPGPWMTALKSETFGIANPSSRTICSRIEMLKYMPGVREWSAGSPTALRILDYVEASSVKIHVIGMKGCGYSCFDSDCPTQGEGTAYVDIERPYSVAGAKLHTYVVVLHELGHAKQYIENPFWFNQVATSRANVDLKEIQTAALSMEAGIYTPHRFARGNEDNRKWIGVQKNPQPSLRGPGGMGADWKPTPVSSPPRPAKSAGPASASSLPVTPIGGPPTPPAPPGGGPPPPPLRVPGAPPPPGALGGPGGLSRQDKLDLAKYKFGLKVKDTVTGKVEMFEDPHKKWAMIVEQDNMARHEWPICKDKGQPVRPGYNYIKIG